MQKQKFPSKDNNILENKYQITKKLKSGGFGSVYYAKGMGEDTNKYAIKFTHKSNERYCNIEKKIYKLMRQKKISYGFIKYFDFGIVEDQIYQVMELIGYDLQQIMIRMKSKKFTVKTVLMIGLQVIDRIQALHEIGYVHRDIKPDNLAIGNKDRNNIIYLFDFGLAIKDEDSVPNYEKGKVIGTLAYMSLREHQGKKANYFDDIESFVYTLVYLMQGTLPWMHIVVSNIADTNKIKAMKSRLDRQWFIKNKIPIELSEILEIAKNKKDLPTIDYLNIKYKLLSALKGIHQENDFIFDWTGLIKVTHDSPEKKVQQREKINKVNQSNQKHVQEEIYQIYKFMDNQKKYQLKSEEKNNPKKLPQKQKIGSKPKIQSPRKIKNQKQGIAEQSKKAEEIKKVQRPGSAKSFLPQKPKRPASSGYASRQATGDIEKIKYLREIQQRLAQMQSAKYEGPKVVIYHTTNYKL